MKNQQSNDYINVQIPRYLGVDAIDIAFRAFHMKLIPMGVGTGSYRAIEEEKLGTEQGKSGDDHD